MNTWIVILGVGIALLAAAYAVSNVYESHQATARECPPGTHREGSFWSYPAQPRCVPD